MEFDFFFNCTTTKFLLLGNHGLNSVVHVLNKVDFGSAESSLVGDVINVIGRFRVLTVDASNLQIIADCKFL